MAAIGQMPPAHVFVFNMLMLALIIMRNRKIHLRNIMTSSSETAKTRPAWFLGAAYGRTNDQTARLLWEGLWENGYHDRYLDLACILERFPGPLEQ